MLKPILPKQEKTKKKKETITNKKGQKLTIIRPPIPRPNP